MKKIIIICFFITGALVSKAQSIASDKGAVEMLKEFYTAYNIVWSTDKYPRLQKRLDSLQKKYCTMWLRKQLKDSAKGEGLDHDLLINDEFTDVSHLKTLKIIQDGKKANAYVVSYVYHTSTATNKPIEKTVEIHVTVAKENGSYKIANAYGDEVSLQ